jgi:hypothetical protein
VDAVRALIETILLERDGDQLKITLKGDLAGMLRPATNIICSSGDLRHEPLAHRQSAIRPRSFSDKKRTVAANPRASVTSFECGGLRR